MVEFDNNTAGTWTCSCGKTNTGKFCVNCGAQRPVAPPPVAAQQTEWVCSCGNRNAGKFCVKCGAPRPAAMPGKPVGAMPSPQDARTQKAARPANGAAAMPPKANRPVGGTVAMPPRSNKPAGSTVTAPPRNSKPVTANGSEAVAALAAEEAATRKAAEEAAARKAAEEAAARKAAEEAAARKAAEEAATRKAAEAKAVQEAAKKQEAPVSSSAEAEGNNGMMKKIAIGAAVLLLLIGAYFMFGKKKETPSVAEPPKVETKAEAEKKDDGTVKPEAEKPMDPAVKAEKLKKYAEEMKAANAQKKQDATANEKIVFLVENVQRKGSDLTISGHFYNGKKNRTIISVKALELDIVLRDVDKELLNEKNIKYTKAFTGMEIKPLQDSPVLTVELPGKAPKDEFNNFAVTVHDVHWEGIGK